MVFGGNYGWDEGHVGLTFISVWIGLALALVATPMLEKNYRARMRAKGGKADPEDRLIGMMVGAIWVPICQCISFHSSQLKFSAHRHRHCNTALFIFGWTSPPAVKPGGGNWVGPVSSGIPFGFGSTSLPVIHYASPEKC